jgi:PIN domain nuclease of toxin-antitoxin system
LIRVLLDTHTFLWAILEPQALSKSAKEFIADPTTEVFVSSVTAWEIATKYRIGKLPDARIIVENYQDHLLTFAAEELAVKTNHALLAGSFQQAHRDPFDRLLVAQSILEGIPLVTNDGVFRNFPINALW